MITTNPSENFQYYDNTTYWNDFELITDKFNFLISGNQKIDWINYCHKKYGKFENSFFINCGNGWVERDVFSKNLITKVTAFDYSENYIEEAKAKALDIGLECNYFVADCNKVNLNSVNYDLVVNYAAMHHVAYINRLTYNIALSLKENDGYYFGYDYIGPHRNQYSWLMWSEMVQLNETLPECYRVGLTYPHFKTMVHYDPTEAIHSEIQIDVLKRYFDIEQFTPLGGAIAYQLLFNNKQLYQDRDTDVGRAIVKKIMQIDEEFCKEHPDMNLFAFWIAKPKKVGFPDQVSIKNWQEEENKRELLSIENNAIYYPPTTLEIIYNDFDTRIRNDLNSAQLKVSNELSNFQKQNEELLIQIEAKNNTICEGQQLIDKLQEDIESNAIHIVKLQEDIKTKNLHIANIYKSSSWKITRPLRFLKNLIRL